MKTFQRRTKGMLPATGTAIRGLLVAVLLAAGATVPVVAQDAPEAAAAKPKVVVSEPVFDAGTVATGSEIIHDFVIQNQGSAPLEITDVRPACGCTVAQFDRVVAPGASGKVHAVLDTSTFAGAIAKGITVLTNDPARPRLDLTVKAEVQPHLIADPGFARFVQPQLSDPGVVEQRVWTPSFDGLELRKVTSPYPFLTVTHRRITEQAGLHEKGVGPQHELTLELDYTKAPIGSLAGYVVVETNHPQQAELKLPVSGFVRPLVVATPDTADFGALVLDEDGASGTLVLKHYGVDPLVIRGAEATVPHVEVAVEEVEPGRQFNVTVQLPPDMPKGSFDGFIRLSTNNPRKPTVEIPLKGSVS
jgi:hypothetical protein